GTALVSAEFRSMARSSPTAAFQAKGRQPLENIEQRVQTFEILSKRQRFARAARRFSWGAGAAAVAAAMLFFAPTVVRFAQEKFQSQADASTTSTQTASTQPASTPLSAAVTTTPAIQAGQTFTDCNNCPEMVVLPGGLYMMGSPQTETGRGRDEGPQREVS